MISKTDSIRFIYSIEHIRVKVYVVRGVAPALDRSRSAKLLHLCCGEAWIREAWIGWMSPSGKPFLANSDTELAEFFQTVECGANIRRAQLQPGEQRQS
jgi:hypothetical protein